MPWERVSEAPLGEGILVLETTGDGFVALAGERDQSLSTSMWRSDDGLLWNQLDVEPAIIEQLESSETLSSGPGPSLHDRPGSRGPHDHRSGHG